MSRISPDNTKPNFNFQAALKDPMGESKSHDTTKLTKLREQKLVQKDKPKM